MLYDVFISHASEDKEELVRNLAQALREHHITVWYDEFSLRVGDSLRESIDKGLAQSRFAVVVLSPHFFAKRWPARELNGLVAREVAEDRNMILPIWHNVGRDEVVAASPPLADLVALSSHEGVPSLAAALADKIRQRESPLVVARDFLLEKGVEPPTISNGWWLDVVQFKESVLRWPDTNLGRRWIFPLPHDEETNEKFRGENIAWSALQWDWSDDGCERGICQLTHPERVHEFLREWPGLMECARMNPGILALYVPQVTIPGYDDGLADVLDDLMSPGRGDANEMPGYDGPDLVEGDRPLCGELIAWRHPKLGNYTERSLTWSFVHAHTYSYYRSEFSDFECLAWLLSDDSGWFPQAIKRALLDGMKKQTTIGWPGDVMQVHSNAFAKDLWDKPRSKFRFTRNVRAALVSLFEGTRYSVGLDTSAQVIAERFIEHDFVEATFSERQRQQDEQRVRRSARR